MVKTLTNTTFICVLLMVLTMSLNIDIKIVRKENKDENDNSLLVYILPDGYMEKDTQDINTINMLASTFDKSNPITIPDNSLMVDVPEMTSPVFLRLNAIECSNLIFIAQHLDNKSKALQPDKKNQQLRDSYHSLTILTVDKGMRLSDDMDLNASVPIFDSWKPLYKTGEYSIIKEFKFEIIKTFFYYSTAGSCMLLPTDIEIQEVDNSLEASFETIYKSIVIYNDQLSSIQGNLELLYSGETTEAEMKTRYAKEYKLGQTIDELIKSNPSNKIDDNWEIRIPDEHKMCINDHLCNLEKSDDLSAPDPHLDKGDILIEEIYNKSFTILAENYSSHKDKDIQNHLMKLYNMYVEDAERFIALEDVNTTINNNLSVAKEAYLSVIHEILNIKNNFSKYRQSVLKNEEE